MIARCPSCDLSNEYEDNNKDKLQCKRCNLVFSLSESYFPDRGISERIWNVKGEKGLPVSLRVLRSRVKSGTLKENDEISSNGKNWIKAVAHPLLNMSFSSGEGDKGPEKKNVSMAGEEKSDIDSINSKPDHIEYKKHFQSKKSLPHSMALTFIAILIAGAILYHALTVVKKMWRDNQRLSAENITIKRKLSNTEKKLAHIEKRVALLDDEFERVKSSGEEFLKARKILEDIKKSIDSNKLYLALSLAKNRLYVKIGTKTVKKYVDSTGKGKTYLKGSGEVYNFLTPRGKRIINSKEKKPVWYKPDWAWHEKGLELPDNISIEDRAVEGEMGKYRLKMGEGYAIQGTKTGRINGRKETHGCIRLARNDLKELYTYGKKWD